MSERDDLARLRSLDERIAKVKAGLEPPKAEPDHHSMAQIGWRMVVELVVGLGVGFGIGYGLDVLFGTLPLFLVVMTLLGFAAGVKSMLRTAREFDKKDDAAPQDAGAEQGDDRRGR